MQSLSPVKKLPKKVRRSLIQQKKLVKKKNHPNRCCCRWVLPQSAWDHPCPGCKNYRFATRPLSPWTGQGCPLTALVHRCVARNSGAELHEPQPRNTREKSLKPRTAKHCIITTPKLEKHERHGSRQRPRSWKALLVVSSHGELQSGAGSPNAKRHPQGRCPIPSHSKHHLPPEPNTTSEPTTAAPNPTILGGFQAAPPNPQDWGVLQLPWVPFLLPARVGRPRPCSQGGTAVLEM